MGLSYSICSTSWGWVGLLAGPDGIRKLVLPQLTRDETLKRLGTAPDGTRGGGGLSGLEAKLRDYFSGRMTDFDEMVDLSGYPAFYRQVWEHTRSIAYGSTASYGQIAAWTGRPGASRAVGRALGRNPVPIIIPCHRVIRTDGSIGGFSAGTELKTRLIELERAGFKPEATPPVSYGDPC